MLQARAALPAAAAAELTPVRDTHAATSVPVRLRDQHAKRAELATAPLPSPCSQQHLVHQHCASQSPPPCHAWRVYCSILSHYDHLHSQPLSLGLLSSKAKVETVAWGWGGGCTGGTRQCAAAGRQGSDTMLLDWQSSGAF